MQYEDFGNFHYGVVAYAFGFPEPIALNEAGRAEFKDAKATGWKTRHYGQPCG